MFLGKELLETMSAILYLEGKLCVFGLGWVLRVHSCVSKIFKIIYIFWQKLSIVFVFKIWIRYIVQVVSPTPMATQSMNVGNDCGTSAPHFWDFTASKLTCMTTVPIFG